MGLYCEITLSQLLTRKNALALFGSSHSAASQEVLAITCPALSTSANKPFHKQTHWYSRCF